MHLVFDKRIRFFHKWQPLQVIYQTQASFVAVYNARIATMRYTSFVENALSD